MGKMRALQLGAMLLVLVACVRHSSRIDTDASAPDPVSLKPHDTVDLALLTPDQRAALVTRRSRDSIALDETGFNRREAMIQDAYFIPNDMIEEMNARNVSDILGHVPGLGASLTPGTTRQIGGCYNTFVNGLPRAKAPGDLDADIPARDVIGLEVYPPGQLLPSPFSRSGTRPNCTTVALWTRSKVE